MSNPLIRETSASFSSATRTPRRLRWRSRTLVGLAIGALVASSLSVVPTTAALAVVPAVLFVSYLGVIGQAAGGTRRYDGPLGKADRMLLLGAYCPLAFLTPHAGTVIALALLVGLALTAVNRVRAMQVELS